MSFQKQSVNSLREIRPLLEKRLPITTMILNIVDISIAGKFALEGDYAEIYTYVDEGSEGPREDNLFICAVLTPGCETPFTVVYARGPEVVTQKSLNAFINLHEFSKPVEFGALPHNFVDHLKGIFADMGGTASFHPADDMYLPTEVALKLDVRRDDLEEEFEVDKLDSDNAAKINSHWRYGCTGGEANMAKAINALGGIGIYRKGPGAVLNSKDNDSLVSWVVFRRVGTFNALHTLPEYRGKGLGSWTMKAASKQIAEKGLIPLCEIEPYNSESRRLVERIGYQLIHTVNWVTYKPKST